MAFQISRLYDFTPGTKILSSQVDAELNQFVTAHNGTDLALTNHSANTSNPHSVTKSQVGLGNCDNTSDVNKPISTAQQAALDLKATIASLTSHTGNTSNPHSVTKSQVGLGNCDNTSDVNKPVSTAQQAALDLKATIVSLSSHTGNTSNPHSVTKSQVGLGNADNTSDVNKPVSTAQQTALDLKANVTDLSSHTGNTSNPHSTTKSQVGLGNVDNTSDVNKPVSTAQQTALDLKANQATTYTKTEVDNAISAATPTSTAIGNLINSSTEKTTPVDADMFALMDSAGSNILKKFSWASLKAKVIDALLTGLSTATNAVITATDSIVVACGKLQAQITGHKADYISHPGYGVAGGTANAITVSTTPALPALVDGVKVRIKITTQSYNPNPTLNWDGTGAKAIARPDNTGLREYEGSLKVGKVYEFEYNSTLDRYVVRGAEQELISILPTLRYNFSASSGNVTELYATANSLIALTHSSTAVVTLPRYFDVGARVAIVMKGSASYMSIRPYTDGASVTHSIENAYGSSDYFSISGSSDQLKLYGHFYVEFIAISSTAWRITALKAARGIAVHDSKNYMMDTGGFTFYENFKDLYLTGDTTLSYSSLGYRHTKITIDKSTLLTITLPNDLDPGRHLQIMGYGAGGWKIAQADNVVIHNGSTSTTVGTGGYLASSNRYDCVDIECVMQTDGSHAEYLVTSSKGTITTV